MDKNDNSSGRDKDNKRVFWIEVKGDSYGNIWIYELYSTAGIKGKSPFFR